MKRIILLILLLWSLPANAQDPARGTIRTTGLADCSTLGSCVRLETVKPDAGTIAIQVSGVFSGAPLTFEATTDGSNYILATGCSGRYGAVSGTGAIGTYQCSASGLVGFQVRGTGSMVGAANVTIQSGSASPSSAGLSSTLTMGALGLAAGVNNDGLRVSVPALRNKCATEIATDAAISQTATAVQITGKAGMRIMVCQMRLVVSAAVFTNEWEGSGSACGTGTIAHSGSTTASSGEPYGANGGYTTTQPFVLKEGNDFCVGQSGAGTVAGKASYIYVPANLFN